MSESVLQAQIRLATGKIPNARLFRNQRGLMWAGKVVDRTPITVTLAQPRQLECGLTNGAADLIGLTTITITPEMVGQTVAVFTSGEVKQPGVKVPDHQTNWHEFVLRMGGRSAILRSPEDAVRLVTP